ncbi:similar to Saccharomyces cerevisiae YER158C Protein of unknown function, has similarity to Afr1p [Maudiozyma saulgeensis]|uniref:Uncharacterized protein n=1 Tax=Maudiozyma saulgeensis TaxID=1789683 RepID=A0A1X7R7T9_9SACH|nr:similar to Saccharomyces cerevisiae YER158C Protein of unknown function, has similarity to Afr1p [Kazachstania saulgeensis]
MVARSNTYSVRRPNTINNNNNNNNMNSSMNMGDPFFPQYPMNSNTNNNNNNNNNMRRNTSVRRTRSINAHIYTPVSNENNSRSIAIGSSPYDFANSLATQNKGMKPLLNDNQIMSPYQLQKQKMQKSFVFSNGEVFTPRTPCNNTATPTLIKPVDNEDSIVTSSPKKSRGKLSSFFKGLVRNKSISRDSNKNKPVVPTFTPIPVVTITVPTTPSLNINNKNDNILQRLEKQWDTVHLNTSINNSISTPTIHSTSFGSSLSISLNDSLDIDENENNQLKNNRHVKFATGVYVDETFSGLEYERADSEDDGKGDSGVSNFNNNSIKAEVNQYKRNEMFVHPDSRRNTHFFR